MTQTDVKLFGPLGPTLDPESWAPAGVRGADKVATRYCYALLTPSGSVPGRPDDGSPFTELARGFRSEFDVFAAFAASEVPAANTVKSAELEDDPDSEKLGTVRLAAVTLSGGVVTLTLSVTAADGSVPSEPVEFTADT